MWLFFDEFFDGIWLGTKNQRLALVSLFLQRTNNLWFTDRLREDGDRRCTTAGINTQDSTFLSG